MYINDAGKWPQTKLVNHKKGGQENISLQKNNIIIAEKLTERQWDTTRDNDRQQKSTIYLLLNIYLFIIDYLLFIKAKSDDERPRETTGGNDRQQKSIIYLLLNIYLIIINY